MDEKKVKTWRLVLHIIATVSMILVAIMYTQPFTKLKLTGEDVYTGFELCFGKTVSSPFGDIQLVEASGGNIVGFVLIIFFIIPMLFAFEKMTKRRESYLRWGFFISILLGAYIYISKDYAKYTTLSVKAEAMELGTGAILAIVFCGISAVCLFLRTFVFKVKKEEKKKEEKE